MGRGVGVLVLAFLATACIGATVTTPAMPLMYEISTRPWLYSLSLKYGKNISTLSQIPVAEFQALADQGINYVWMMGIWELGVNNDKSNSDIISTCKCLMDDCVPEDDIIGSPYAVHQYIPNSQLGSADDVSALRATLNSIGMKLMLDFVPNHSSIDSPWITNNITYYVRSPGSPPYDDYTYMSNGVAYGSCIYCTPWTDTAQLNYWDSGARDNMLQQIMTIASLADAVRCDMAHCILNSNINTQWGTILNSWGYTWPSSEFWAWAIPQVKAKYPNFIFLAETYDFNDQLNILINQGFDFVYEKTILDRLKQCDLDEIRNWITYAETQTFWKHSAHFVENHDEDRSANVFSYNCDQVMCGGYPDCCGSICPADGYSSCCDCNTCNDAANSASCCSATNCPGRSRAHMAAVVSMTLPGMRFFFQDQWEGYENKLDVHFRRAQPETPWTYTSDFYTKFNAIVKDSAFTSGTWTYLSVTGTTDCWRLMAWKWNYNGSSKRLVVVNFSDTSGSGYIVLSDVSGSGTVTITELFTGTQYQRSAEDLRSTGLIVVVSPWSSQIFQYP